MRYLVNLKREYIVGALLFILTTVIRGYYIWHNVLYYIREGSTGMAAWMILDGQVLYRDLYYAQSPLWAYLVAIMYAIFGVGLRAGRVILVFWSGVTVLVIFFSGLKKINMKTGLLGGLIFALHPIAQRYGILLFNDIPALTLCLIAYYLLDGVYENNRHVNNQVWTKKAFWNPNKKIFFAGIFLGLGFSIKLIVGPILAAFILIHLIEGYIEGINLKIQVKNIVILIFGFVITVGAIFAYFLINAKDDVIYYILIQHLSKTPKSPINPLLTRIKWPFSRYWSQDKYLVFITLLSLPFALRTRYGRGLIIISATLIISVILLVPRVHHNYYDMHIPIIAMVCGIFPLSISAFSNLRVKFRVDRVLILQILAWIIIIGSIINIALNPPHNIRPMDEDVIVAVEWVKVTIAPDEYILCDDTNINIMSQRRGPFAELSIDRTELGNLDSDMLIQSLYDYNIRAVVVTGRLFGRYSTFNDFMGFVWWYYTKIEVGLTIYVRDSPLS